MSPKLFLAPRIIRYITDRPFKQRTRYQSHLFKDSFQKAVVSLKQSLGAKMSFGAIFLSLNRTFLSRMFSFNKFCLFFLEVFKKL